MFRKRYTQNIVNVIAMFICLCIVFIGTNILNNLEETKENIKTSIETEWRQQAKRTLSMLETKFQNDVTLGYVNPDDELSLQKWATENLTGVLNGGPTGDCFMVKIYYKDNKLVGKFMWDDSTDCSKPEFITNGRYLTDEPPMHQDPEQATIICNNMLLCESTLNNDFNYWWNFDGSPELLEWTVEPIGMSGFDNQNKTIGGIVNTKYTKILIALGTQKDEIESTFTKDLENIDKTIAYTQIFIAISIGVCVLNMIIYVYLSKKAERRY